MKLNYSPLRDDFITNPAEFSKLNTDNFTTALKNFMVLQSMPTNQINYDSASSMAHFEIKFPRKIDVLPGSNIKVEVIQWINAKL